MKRILLVVMMTGAMLRLGAQSYEASAKLDALIEEAVKKDQIPGAVLLVGKDDKILHRKAYGSRALVPSREAMTVDTVFDAASLTKVIATTSAIMKLFEEGKIRLNDPVTRYIPEYQGGKSDITVRHLLVHFSGLRPDLDLKPVWSGYKTGIKLACVDKPATPPGTRFVYSDINFILLGEIVQRLSGKTLPEFVREQVFQPLGMKESLFQPPASLRPRIAPTERVDGVILRGVVHDPTTRYMGGNAGHAGLFTTADDLSRFARMMLHMGELDGVRVFSPLTVKKFTEPNTPPGQPVLRGLGWDIDSRYSSNRGELFPIGSYGHTGFTGTSIWIDPSTNGYVILLANSVHPNLRPAITGLRGRVATVVAASFGIDARKVLTTGYSEADYGVRRVIARNGKTMTGLDVLAAKNFAPLAGKRVGLITNHTGLTREGKRNVDAMVEAGVKVTALFSPEHGITGKEDHENIGNTKDAKTGIPVYSLYAGKNRRPSDESLKNVDVLVFDIQDVGARFYTYMCTMVNSMEEAARVKLPFMVLDRPNPINGVQVEGPMLDDALKSFVGCVNVPLRHGMTLGEIAMMVNREHKLGVKLDVVKVEDWQRGDWFDSTGLPWVDPSPNMRSFNAALLYTGVAMLEGARNYSVGRGTDAPFEQIGADWIRGVELAAYLNGRGIPGVRFYPTRFQPNASNFSGKPIEGIRFVITDRESFLPVRLGTEIGVALEKLYPGKYPWKSADKLIGNRDALDAMARMKDARDIQQAQEDALQAFRERRKPYLLY